MLACACLIAAPLASRAQDAPPVRLPPVVVTATQQTERALDVPAAVDVIDAAEIRRARPAADLSESLERIPGVVARDRQNQAQDVQISIRGFGARSTFGVRSIRLYNDDIPASTPDGQGQVSHFSLGAAGRIEVLRGPFSALYGNASGGVIKVFTAHAPDAPTLSAGVVAGSDGFLQSSLSWHAPWGTDAGGDVLLDATRLDSDGYRDHSRARRDTAQALVRGDTRRDGRFTLLFDRLDLDAQDPQGLTATQLQGDRRAASAGALAFDTRKHVRQTQAGFHLEQPVVGNHSLVVTAYATRRDTQQMLSIPTFVQAGRPLQGGGALALERQDHGMDMAWHWTPNLLGGAASLVLGAEVQRSDELRRGYENFIGDRLGVYGALRRDERDRVTSRDIYLQAGWDFAPNWRLDAGVRRSRVGFTSDDHFVTPDNPDDSGRLDFANTAPVIGLLFHATPTLSLFANAGVGYETPTFSELAYRRDGRSGLNADLRAARSENYEIGLRSQGESMRLSAAAFESRTHDELVVAANDGGRSSYDNAGLSRRRGVELSLSAQASDRWHVAAAYTLLDARYLRDVCPDAGCSGMPPVIAAGRHVPGLARQSAWAELRWTPRPQLDLILQGRFVDRVYVDDANSEAAPAYATVDLALERGVAFAGLDWTGYARLDNLLDRAYVGSVIVNESNGRYYEPAPGRTWSIGVSVERKFD